MWNQMLTALLALGVAHALRPSDAPSEHAISRREDAPAMRLSQRPPPPARRNSPEFSSLAGGIHLIRVARHQGKVVVAEFGTFLGIIEAPHDERTVREVIDLLSRRFPDKPLRFAFHTHHHDHSMHAIDCLLAAGVQIVTSPYNLEELAKVTGSPSLLRSRALVIGEAFELADGFNRMSIRVLRQGAGEGQWGVPTSEYMVFVFPGQKAIVSGCLFNKPLTYHEVVNTRKLALRKFIDSCGFPIETIIPTSTDITSGVEHTCSTGMLDETIAMGIKPEEIVARYGPMTPDQLLAARPELLEEFRKIPRAYDIMVCASALVRAGCHEHAVVFHEAAIELFPWDAAPRLRAGGILWKLGRKQEAEVRWAESLTLARDEEEREEFTREIDEMRKSELAQAR